MLTAKATRQSCVSSLQTIAFMVFCRLGGSMFNLMEACMATGSYWSGRLLGLLVAVSEKCCQAFPGQALRLQLSSGGRLLWPASECCTSAV